AGRRGDRWQRPVWRAGAAARQGRGLERSISTGSSSGSDASAARGSTTEWVGSGAGPAPGGGTGNRIGIGVGIAAGIGPAGVGTVSGSDRGVPGSTAERAVASSLAIGDFG